MSSNPRNIIWIASYPKSGNTWVRFLACNLLHGRIQSAADLAALAPDIHDLIGAGQALAPSPLMKTHFAFSADLPLADNTAAAIYVVRDPADVLASNYFYSKRIAGPATALGSFDDYANAFIRHRGDPRWLKLGMGSWEQNVRSWHEAASQFPILRLRYEDIVTDPMGACRALAQLLRPQSSESEIRQAVENASFEGMREIERADIRAQRVGIFYKPYLQASIDAGGRFMRRGVIGDGAARLSTEQRADLHSALGPLLRELGYSAERA
jgi:hypothetical protein